MPKALIIIDLQNDYFPGGAYPALEHRTRPSRTSSAAIAEGEGRSGTGIIHVQHVADPSRRASRPFFNEGTHGAEIHERIRAAAPDAPVVRQGLRRQLRRRRPRRRVLSKLGADELLVCGMMTQNCVTHTAISKSAEPYDVTILPDCCTTVDEMLHNIALHAVSTRTRLLPSTEAFQATDSSPQTGH